MARTFARRPSGQSLREQFVNGALIVLVCLLLIFGILVLATGTLDFFYSFFHRTR